MEKVHVTVEADTLNARSTIAQTIGLALKLAGFKGSVTDVCAPLPLKDLAVAVDAAAQKSFVEITVRQKENGG